jgi:signal transduction histidine kinase
MKPKEYGGRILSIAQMLKDFSTTSGVVIDFDVRGNLFKLYTSAEITLYRNAQEAVTNAVRHGQAQKIEVLLEYRNNEVMLLVSDNGVGCSNLVKGIGMNGMKERVELLGGNLELDYGNGYFKVRTIIPVKQEA